MRRVANDEVDIIIDTFIPDDADDFHGAYIDDYDSDNGRAYLFVKMDEIQADFTHDVEALKTEAWGVVQYNDIHTIEVLSCQWQGFDIINSEDVCFELSARFIDCSN